MPIPRSRKLIIWEIDSNVFTGDITKSIVNKYKGIEKQMEGSRFSFKFVNSLSNRCDKVNVQEIS